MSERQKHFATYLYPGVFFPEDTTREIQYPNIGAALVAAPDDEEGYFVKDRWYAVKIRTNVEERFTSDAGVEKWVLKETVKVGSWVVGEKVHNTDSRIEGDKFSTLRLGLQQTKDGFGVLCRTGNWQYAEDYDYVISDAEIKKSEEVAASS